MSDNYKGEICGGCQYLGAPIRREFPEALAGMHECTKKDTPTHPAWEGGSECDDFTPTIQCRIARAAERRADALERIAEAFFPGPHGAIVVDAYVVKQ